MAGRRKPTLSPAQKRDATRIAKSNARTTAVRKGNTSAVARNDARHAPRSTAAVKVKGSGATTSYTRSSGNSARGNGINPLSGIPKPNFPKRKDYSGNPLKP